MSLASADDALRDHLKLPNGQGLVVTALDGNSPAAHAGIQLNDVLLRLGETPLGKPEDLDESLRKAGENPVSLALIRGGSQRVIQVQPQIRVTLGPAQPKAARHQYWIGVSVSAIGPALRSQLEIPTNSGLIVNEVVNDSPAAKAGVKVHDILLELDGKPLSDPGKLAEAVQLHGEKPIVAKFIRAGQNKSSSVLLTPAQRKTEAVASRDRPVQKYYFVRPGAVQYETMPYQAQPANSAIFYDWTTNSVSNQANSKNQKPAEDANAAVSKRLDALDAEIKQLRKAVEAIGKAEKTIEELNKAAAALNKAIKDSK